MLATVINFAVFKTPPTLTQPTLSLFLSSLLSLFQLSSSLLHSSFITLSSPRPCARRAPALPLHTLPQPLRHRSPSTSLGSLPTVATSGALHRCSPSLPSCSSLLPRFLRRLSPVSLPPTLPHPALSRQVPRHFCFAPIFMLVCFYLLFNNILNFIFIY